MRAKMLVDCESWYAGFCSTLAKTKSGCLPFRTTSRSDATCLRTVAVSDSVVTVPDVNPPLSWSENAAVELW